MVKIDKKKIEKLLKDLANLPQIKEVKALRKRFSQDLEKISKKEKPVITKVPDEEKIARANAKRSSYMKKKWNYIRQIYSNYPEVRKEHGLRELYSMYSKRKKGQDVPIGDVYWQNPSQ